jgi:hypothetical protein
MKNKKNKTKSNTTNNNENKEKEGEMKFSQTLLSSKIGSVLTKRPYDLNLSHKTEKIENVFQGRLLDTQELFSLEVAVATYQTNVTADFFIKGIAEIESDLVAEITNMIVDTTAEQLTTVEGRTLITEKIKSELNNYLVEEDFNPDIHFVYIINYNII